MKKEIVFNDKIVLVKSKVLVVVVSLTERSILKKKEETNNKQTNMKESFLQIPFKCKMFKNQFRKFNFKEKNETIFFLSFYS